MVVPVKMGSMMIYLVLTAKLAYILAKTVLTI